MTLCGYGEETEAYRRQSQAVIRQIKKDYKRQTKN